MGDAVAFLPARANATNPHAEVEFRHFLAAVCRQKRSSGRRLQVLNAPLIYEPVRQFFLKKRPQEKRPTLRELIRKPVAPIIRTAAVMLESQDVKVIRPDTVIHRKRETRHPFLSTRRLKISTYNFFQILLNSSFP